MPKGNKTISAEDLLGKIAKTTKESKSKVQLLSEDSIKDAVDNFIEKTRQYKDMKAELELLEQEISVKSNEWYANQKGEANSVKYAGGNGGAVLVTYKDAFSKISKEVSDEIEKKMKDKFDNFFKEKRTIQLKETATDNDTIDFLLQALGETKFVEIFDVEVATVPVDGMDKKQFELPAEVRGLIKQFKPAFRVS
ncbi:MAG: hypothetical protein JETCAE03_33540 [Ignavibacteriaceae bacterium]|nr:MAG: hypothetical protein JETCAE03_33540 [Ignavibacteriaceae bacterium]